MSGTNDLAELESYIIQPEEDRRGLTILSKEFLKEVTDQGEFYPSREDRIAYAKQLIESGKAQVELSDRFKDSPHRDDIIAGLLTNRWLIPAPHWSNEIPLQASTGHGASPSTLVLDLELTDKSARVDIVAKPMGKPRKVKRETTLLSTCLERGIRCAEPLGTLAVQDELGKKGYTLTLLEHGVTPLSSIRLEGIRITSGDEKVKSILRGIGEFVAHLHNQGLSHGDLHPGNLGIDLRVGSVKEFLLFDMEKAHFLTEDHLKFKKKATKVNLAAQAGFREMEIGYLKDVAKITAYMVLFNRDGFDENILKDTIIESYLAQRDREQGQFSKEEYPTEFDRYYQKYYRDAEIQQQKQREERK